MTNVTSNYFDTKQISGLLRANLNVGKILCNFQHKFTVKTEAVPALTYSLNSGQVNYCDYLITI